VTDDWPEDVPVTEAEIGVFEVWFGELFDELFDCLETPAGTSPWHRQFGHLSTCGSRHGDRR
jgi:hypothetical protein